MANYLPSHLGSLCARPGSTWGNSCLKGKFLLWHIWLNLISHTSDHPQSCLFWKKEFTYQPSSSTREKNHFKIYSSRLFPPLISWALNLNSFLLMWAGWGWNPEPESSCLHPGLRRLIWIISSLSITLKKQLPSSEHKQTVGQNWSGFKWR